MFKRVDVPTESLEGFAYENQNREIETVKLLANTVKISVTGASGNCEVYHEDVPKLILALQAAYDHNKGK